MRKCANFSRRPLVIYDFAPHPSKFHYIWRKFYFVSYRCSTVLMILYVPLTFDIMVCSGSTNCKLAISKILYCTEWRLSFIKCSPTCSTVRLALIQVLPRREGALTDRAPGAHHCVLQGAPDRQNIHRKDFLIRIPWVLSLELISLARSLREGFLGKYF